VSKTTARKAKAPAKKPAQVRKAPQAAARATSRKPAKPSRSARPGASSAKPGARAKPAARASAKPGLRKPSGKTPGAKSAGQLKPAGKTTRKAPLAKAKASVQPNVPSRVKPAAPVPVKTPSKVPAKTGGAGAATPPAAPAPKPAPVKTAPARAPRPGKAPLVLPISPPSPLTSSRFADRFAPPKPPTRQMNHEFPDVVRTPHKADPKLANAWKAKAGAELTEDEVLAMPDNEYMNDKQLDFFRARLRRLKDDLLSNAGETTEHLREDTSIVPDPADRATIEEEHALELRTRDRERKLMKKISQSLVRIESGDYGFCDETGEPIGLGRLIARPTATLSLEAQQRRELKQKMFGD